MANTGQYDSQTNIETEDYEREIFVRPEAAVIYGGSVVNSVNGQVGDVILTTSDLENTSDYQTGAQVQNAIAGKQNVIADLPQIRSGAEAGATAVQPEDLARIATTGSYNDSLDKPSVNNVSLIGNISLDALGIQPKGNYALESEIPDVSNFITNTVDNLVNYYKKSETFTKQEVNDLISAITTMDIQVVQTLPTEDISTTTIYFVPKTTAEQNDAYDEYIYVSNAWEHIGSTEVDLTNYVTNTDYATNSTGGVFKVSSTYGLAMSQAGILYGSGRTYAQYQSADANLIVAKGTLDSVITGKGLVSNGDLARIATTGSYNDSIDKPSINNVELVGNKTLNDLGIVALDEFYKAFPTDTASGAVASFTDGADNLPLKSLVVNIDPIQDTSQGDPSPENICPISGWTGANVTRTGKNLLALIGANTTDVIQTINETTGEVSIADTTAIKWASKPFGYSDVVAEQTYIFSATGIKYGRIGGSMNTAYPNAVAGNIPDCTTSGGGITSLVTQSVTARTFTPHFTGRIYWHFCTDTNNGSSHQAFTMTPMIEIGSTASSFEPYSGTTYPISIGQTVYGGTLDVTTGKLTVDRAMVDLGTRNWYPSPAAGRTRFRTVITDIERISSPNIVAPMLCSKYPTKSANQTYQGTTGVSLQQNSADIYIYDPQTESMTTAEFKSAMSGVQLVYKLATPIEIQLDPREINTLLGVNNIWADTGDTEVEYRADTKLYINKMIGDAETISTRLASGGRETALYKGAINPIETNIPLEEEGVEYEKT